MKSSSESEQSSSDEDDNTKTKKGKSLKKKQKQKKGKTKMDATRKRKRPKVEIEYEYETNTTTSKAQKLTIWWLVETYFPMLYICEYCKKKISCTCAQINIRYLICANLDGTSSFFVPLLAFYISCAINKVINKQDLKMVLFFLKSRIFKLVFLSLEN